MVMTTESDGNLKKKKQGQNQPQDSGGAQDMTVRNFF